MRIEVELTDAQYETLERVLRAQVRRVQRGDQTHDTVDTENILHALRDAYAAALQKATP